MRWSTGLFVSLVVLIGCSKSPTALPQDVPGLVRLLSSDDPAIRQRALGALALLPPDKFGDIQAYGGMSLPGNASQSLQTLVKRLTPIMPARQHNWTKSNEQTEAYLNSVLDQYDRYGQHSDKWDKTVHEFLEAVISVPRT